MGRRRGRHAGERRRTRPGRRRQPLLRRRRHHLRTEGELRHADAHRHAVEHEGVVHLELDVLPVRHRWRDEMMRARPWHAAPLLMLALRAFAAPAASRPSESLYQLKAPLTSQDGRAIGLDVYQGRPVLVTMFYASCQATCPLIIDTLRAVERNLPASQVKNLRVLLVSID